jgi:hypothetical protein
VTRIGSASLSRRALPLALIAARFVELKSAPGASKLAVTRSSARCAAHALRGARRRYRADRLATLAASTGHAPQRALLGRECGWLTISPLGGASLRGHVAHELPARWLRLMSPLKKERPAQIV